MLNSNIRDYALVVDMIQDLPKQGTQSVAYFVLGDRESALLDVEFQWDGVVKDLTGYMVTATVEEGKRAEHTTELVVEVVEPSQGKCRVFIPTAQLDTVGGNRICFRLYNQGVVTVSVPYTYSVIRSLEEGVAGDNTHETVLESLIRQVQDILNTLGGVDIPELDRDVQQLKVDLEAIYAELIILDAELDKKIDATDTYTIKAIDDLLTAKASIADMFLKADKNSVYTRSEVYTKEEVYNRQTTDMLLNNKLNKGDAYLKSDTYNKSEVNVIANSKANKSEVYTKSESDRLNSFQDKALDDLFDATERLTHDLEAILSGVGGNIPTSDEVIDARTDMKGNLRANLSLRLKSDYDSIIQEFHDPTPYQITLNDGDYIDGTVDDTDIPIYGIKGRTVTNYYNGIDKAEGLTAGKEYYNTSTKRTFTASATSMTITNADNLMILPGDWTGKDIPAYFEGTKSIADEGHLSILTNDTNLYDGTHIDGATDYKPNDEWTYSDEYINNGDAIEDLIEGDACYLSVEGNTLISPIGKPIDAQGTNTPSNRVVINGDWSTITAENGSYTGVRHGLASVIKPNTLYSVFCIVTENTLSQRLQVIEYINATDSPFSTIDIKSKETGVFKFLLTSNSTFNTTRNLNSMVGNNLNNGEKITFRVVILEGDIDINKIPISSFTGLHSVGEDKTVVINNETRYGLECQTVGKNLIDITKLTTTNATITNIDTTNNSVTFDIRSVYSGVVIDLSSELYKLRGKPIFGQYILNTNNVPVTSISMNAQYRTSSNNTSQYASLINPDSVFIVPVDCTFLQIRLIANNTNNSIVGSGLVLSNFQLEVGTVATEYEEYKTDILTMYSKYPLSKVGNVVDDLQVARTKQIVLNGSENVELKSDLPSVINGNSIVFNYKIDNYIPISSWNDSSLMLCDRITSALGDDIWNNTGNPYGITVDEHGLFYMAFDKTKVTFTNVEQFKTWLSQNPTTIIYQLAEPLQNEITDINGNILEPKLTSHGYTRFFVNSNVPPSSIRVSTTSVEDRTGYIMVMSNSPYTITYNGVASSRNVVFYDANKTPIGAISNVSSFNTPANCWYVRILGKDTGLLMLSQGSDIYEYEPYRSNVYNINMPPLRSNGDVYDELGNGRRVQRIADDGSVLPQEIVTNVDNIILKTFTSRNHIWFMNEITPDRPFIGEYISSTGQIIASNTNKINTAIKDIDIVRNMARDNLLTNINQEIKFAVVDMELNKISESLTKLESLAPAVEDAIANIYRTRRQDQFDYNQRPVFITNAEPHDAGFKNTAKFFDNDGWVQWYVSCNFIVTDKQAPIVMSLPVEITVSHYIKYTEVKADVKALSTQTPIVGTAFANSTVSFAPPDGGWHDVNAIRIDFRYEAY